MPKMGSKTREELRQKTGVLKEENEEAVYHIPKDYVQEFFYYGKPRFAIARILGRELAKQAWSLNEEEAVELGVVAESEGAVDKWAIKVSK